MASRDELAKRIVQQSWDDFGSGLYGQGKFKDTGRPSSGYAESLDSYLGAPARQAVSEAQQGNFNMTGVHHVLDRVGGDPRLAPTGYDIASKAMDSAGWTNPYLGAGLATAVDFGAQVPIPGMQMGIAGKVEEANAAAKGLLSKITTPEQAVALKGAEREAYLKALDDVHGPRDQRAKGMGFGDDTWYHGTDHTSDIQKFDQEKLGSHTGEGSTKDKFWFSDNPDVAETFADSASRAKIFRKYHGREDSMLRRQGEIWDQLSKELPDVKNMRLLINDPGQRRVMKKYGDINEGQIGLLNEYEDLGAILEGDQVDKRRAVQNTSGQILPVKIRDNNIPTKDMEGKTWQNAGAQIPDGEVKLTNFLEDDGYLMPKATSLGVTNPSKIRSVNAAFDPRFKDSPLLMAGRAGPTPMQINLQAIQNQKQKKKDKDK